ncbi:MAG: hypothetical protein A3B95_02820 [Candidatus Doudnabacteria bacterium RIFCSPHIGHO2_02_FULL_43_13b]|nr:MAG: hypothetical protein A3B95_02820 [Candidatus Doudnabacteria bacterium RIFCSPHIGHO2_02_FULL_43_13b]
MATLKQGKKFLGLIEEISDEQLQNLFGSGLLTDLLECPSPDLVDRKEFQRVLALAITKPKPILDLVSTVTIPARTTKFVAKDHFVVNTSGEAKVKISYLGDNFRKHFLGKTEEPTSETTFRCHKLKKLSRDIRIINKLGGEERAETTLSAMFALMEKQPNGEKGALLNNGYANIFYIRDAAGVLWAVYCCWRDDGWYVSVDSVGNPGEWLDGFQVFSRNSSETKN